MAFLIPALEWNPVSFSGTRTNGSPVVTGISDTSELQEGFVVHGSGIPYNSRILSKTISTITLSQNASSSGTGDLTQYQRYDFEFPPTTDDGEQIEAKQKITESLSGIRQTQTDCFEALRDLRFWFVSKEDRDLLKQDFMIGWAMLGNSFRYYEDQDIDSFIEYENDSKTYKQKRQVKKHPDFLYDLAMKFRRVL